MLGDGKKKCVGCGKAFIGNMKYGIKYFNSRKYCSKGCKKHSESLKHRKNKKYHYNRLHVILLKENKKIGVCNFCKAIRHTEWAKKKGRQYTLNIKNYNELCVPCHRKYDMTDEIRKKMSKTHTGDKKPWLRKQ